MILVGFAQPSIRVLLIEGAVLFIAPPLAMLMLVFTALVYFFMAAGFDDENRPERALPFLLRPLHFVGADLIALGRVHLSCHLLTRQIRRGVSPGPAHERIL